MDARDSLTSITPTGRIAAARLVIVEGAQLKAELLHHFCARNWGFDVLAVERSATDGICAVKRTQPDIILASLAPIEIGVRDFVQHLHRSAPSAKLILLTSVCNEYLLHLVGATEYHGLIYEPEDGLESLAQTIERARQGIRTVSSRIIQCQTALRTAPTAFPKLLSRREQEVLVCIAHSMSDEEIALQLGLSESTSLSHRKKIMSKLGIHSTPKLIRYCHEKGFGSVLPPTPQRGEKVA